MKAKRTLAGALTLAMLATSAVSFQVSAAGAAVTLKGAKVEAEAGGAFSVDVSLEDIPSTKVNVMDFALTYDKSILNVDSVTIGKSADTDVSGDSTGKDAPVFATSIKDGEIAVSWTTALDSASWIAEDGVILTINGTVSKDAKDGTVTPIDFAPVTRETFDGSSANNSSMVIGYLYGTDSASYEIKTEAGSVTIGKGGATTTETTAETTATTSGSADTTTSAKETTETTASGTKDTTDSSKPGSIAKPGNALYGDVNCDSRVEIADAVLLNKIAAGAVSITSDEQRANSDCDANGEVNSSDALVLLKFLVQLVNSLPYAD